MNTLKIVIGFEGIQGATPLIQGATPSSRGCVPHPGCDPLIQGLCTSSRMRPPHPGAVYLIQGLRTSSRGCVPHPGAAYLIQGLRTSSRMRPPHPGCDPPHTGRRIVIESSFNGLFLNKYEYVFAKCFKDIYYLVLNFSRLICLKNDKRMKECVGVC